MRSYILPCPGWFRDAIESVTGRRGVSASDLVRSVQLLVPDAVVETIPDPGAPGPDDRDRILLRSGPRQGHWLKRKPRLQLRLPDGLSDAYLRRALALALTLSDGDVHLVLDPSCIETTAAAGSTSSSAVGNPEQVAIIERDLAAARETADEFRALVSLMAFDIPPDGISGPAEARYVLGFPPDARLDRRQVKARFRMLSQIYHPDRPTGDTRRMAVLIDAARYLESRLALGAM